MTALGPILALLVIASITPGPNNFIVFRTAMTGSRTDVALAIGGVVIGGLALFAAVSAGLGAVRAQVPFAATAMAVAGAAYIAWLGATLIAKSGAAQSADATGLPTGPVAIAIFQVLNPKAWALISTLAAAAAAADLTPAIIMAAIIIVWSSCLTLWAGAGALLAQHLADPAHRRRIDIVLGILLIATAAGLVATTFA